MELVSPRPFHEGMCGIFRDGTKSKTFVEPSGGIANRHMQGDWSGKTIGLLDDELEKRAADPSPADLRQERDVDHAHVFRRVIDVQPPDGPAVEEHDLKRRVRIVAVVLRALQVELHAQECVDLRLIPADDSREVLAGAGVQHPQEFIVAVVSIPKRQFRDGKTPTSAMQKFNGR